MAKPVRKKVAIQSSFPFSMAFMETKAFYNELPDHLHDWHELVYVYRGAGTFFIDHTLYDMSEGDLFLIPGNTIHRASPNQENPVKSTAVFFTPLLIQNQVWGEPFSFLQPFDASSRDRIYKLECSPSLRMSVCGQLEIMAAERAAAGPGYRHAVVLALHQLLLAVNREQDISQRQSPPASASGPAWLRAVMDHIDLHYPESLSLQELSALACVSSSHFCRQFKRWTGMTATDFISVKRIMTARAMLQASEPDLAAIAGACGFESMTHFHRTFKRLTGTTPAAYRRLRER